MLESKNKIFVFRSISKIKINHTPNQNPVLTLNLNPIFKNTIKINITKKETVSLKIFYLKISFNIKLKPKITEN